MGVMQRAEVSFKSPTRRYSPQSTHSRHRCIHIATLVAVCARVCWCVSASFSVCRVSVCLLLTRTRQFTEAQQRMQPTITRRRTTRIPLTSHTHVIVVCCVVQCVCVRVRVCPSRSVRAPLDSTQLDLHCPRSLSSSGSHDGDHRGRRRDTHGRTSDKQKDRHSRTCSGTCRLCGLCVAGSFVVLRVAADRRRSLSELLQLQRSDELHPRRLTATHLDRYARHAVMHVRVSPSWLLRCVRAVSDFTDFPISAAFSLLIDRIAIAEVFSFLCDRDGVATPLVRVEFESKKRENTTTN